MTSPLKKYRRQPKIYIDLPSQGKFYPNNVLYNNTWTNLQVFSMTPNDEILFKTPDALINGDSTVECIKSCCPSITDPWTMPTLDLDTVLVAIRIATYGDTMTIQTRCGNCKAENSYDLSLNTYIDSYASKEFIDSIQIDDFTFRIRPLNYKEYTNNQKKVLALRRALNSVLTNKDVDQETKDNNMNSIYKDIARVQLDTILAQIVSIEIDGEVETNKDEILDFLNNNDKKYVASVKELLEKNNSNYTPPKHKVVCSNEECNHEQETQVNLDLSDFFGKG